MKTLDDYKKDIKEKDLNFFQQSTFTPDEEIKYLEESLRQNNLLLIKYYIEKGVRCDMKSTLVFDNLVKRKKGLETIKYLESQGINFLDIVNGKLVSLSAENNNVEMLKFFINQLEFNDGKITMSLVHSARSFKLHNKIIPIDQLEERIGKMSSVIDILLPKLSQESIEFATETMLNQELKEYLIHRNLELKIPEKIIKIKRKKI